MRYPSDHLHAGKALLVEEILATDGIEGVQVAGPAGSDLLGSRSFLKLLDRFRVADQNHELRWVKIVGVELFQDRGDFDAHTHRTHGLLVANANGDTATPLPTV